MGIMCARKPNRATKGQMTVELAVGIPVFIAVALVVFNAMLFLENCAAFDRQAKEAVRVYATAPAYGQKAGDSAALIQTHLSALFPEDYINIVVSAQGSPVGFTTYTACLRFTPTLFGRGFSGTVFSVVLAPIEHKTQLTVDPYKPGAVL